MDSLCLEVWTDGRIDPQDAVKNAAKILKDHLRPFLGDLVGEENITANLSDEEKKQFKFLSQDVEVLDLTVRASNCLNNANIKIIGELVSKTESRMLKYRNFGKKSLDEIKEKLDKLGFELGMSFSENLLLAIDKEAERVKSGEDSEDN